MEKKICKEPSQSSHFYSKEYPFLIPTCWFAASAPASLGHGGKWGDRRIEYQWLQIALPLRTGSDQSYTCFLVDVGGKWRQRTGDWKGGLICALWRQWHNLLMARFFTASSAPFIRRDNIFANSRITNIALLLHCLCPCWLPGTQTSNVRHEYRQKMIP